MKKIKIKAQYYISNINMRIENCIATKKGYTFLTVCHMCVSDRV